MKNLHAQFSVSPQNYAEKHISTCTAKFLHAQSQSYIVHVKPLLIKLWCAARGYLSFPDASWEKSRQLYNRPHWINMQAVSFHVENNSMKEFIINRRRHDYVFFTHSHFVCICM